MATDYDAPRRNEADEMAEDSLDELKQRRNEAQSAVVDELKRANATLTPRELYRRGLSVGREHIASLVNTLFLAYAGASLPLFLLFTVYKEQPVWYLLNNELISEEIVRTLVGSVCLILAVPITTALAAMIFGKTGVDPDAGHQEHHHVH